MIEIKLTKRQKHLLALLDCGMTNREIAQEIKISEGTVKVHFWRLFKMIGVSSRGHALKWWRQQQPTSSIHDVLMLKAAFSAACKFIDGKVSRQEFDFYREQVAKIGGGAA